MEQVHIVDCLINAGFAPSNVRRHRIFTRAAVIASGPHAEYTMMIAPPLAEGDYWHINVYKIKPMEIGDNLPTDKEVVDSGFRPKYWCVVRNVVTNFLNNN